MFTAQPTAAPQRHARLAPRNETKGLGSHDGFVQTASCGRRDRCRRARRRARLGRGRGQAEARPDEGGARQVERHGLRRRLVDRRARTRTAAAELFRRAGAGKVNVTVGISGTGGGFERFCKGEIDLSDASRPMRVARGRGLQDQQRRLVAGVHGRERCTHGRRESRQHVGDLPDGCRAQEDLGAGLEGQELAGRPLELPERAAPALRAGHRLGDVRVLHGGDQRSCTRKPLGLPGLRGRQRARAGRCRYARRHGVLRLLVLRGEPVRASRPSRSRTRRRGSA